MKRFILIAITCVVVSQKKVKTGFKTECLGREVNGVVILDKKILEGQAVSYRPYLREGDEDINGEILAVNDAEPVTPIVDEEPMHGKSPE